MGDVEPLCPLVPPDKCGWLEMKTMLGWAARWCEFRGGVCQLIRSHEREDRTTRKLSDLRNAVLRLERGHSSDRYIEAAYARSPEEGTHTLRLRTASAPEAKEWVATVQQAQKFHSKHESSTSRVTIVRKDAQGRIGLHLRRFKVESVEAGSPSAVAGLAPGMEIIRVCDTLVKPSVDVAAIIGAAPSQFEVEVLPPREDPCLGLSPHSSFCMVSPANNVLHPRAFTALLFAAKRRKFGLTSPLARHVAAFLPPKGLKVLVVLWGWGNTVESRHILVPGVQTTARDVHQQLDSDVKWLSARGDESLWDTKAVYFSGPSAGPTQGRQKRILPSDTLESAGLGTGRGLALHVVSVESKSQLQAFVASAGVGKRGRPESLPPASCTSPPTAPLEVALGMTISLTQHQRIVSKKDLEIHLLQAKVRDLKDALAKLQEKNGLLPWDEEEPSIVASLRDRVEAANSLDELESLEVEQNGFFTPVASPTSSDWGGIEPSAFEKVCDTSFEEAQWEGPADAPRAGAGMVVMKPRGHIEDLPPNAATEGFAEGWHLRNVGYKKSGEKVPSLDSLYAVAGVDLWKSRHPVKNIGDQMQLPAVAFDTKGLPAVIVFNMQVPFCEAPSVWGSSGGPTVNIVVTFVIKQSTVDSDAPAVGLLRQLYGKSTEEGDVPANTPFLGRFKLLVRAEKGVPKALSGYNGKPVLVTRSGTYIRRPRYLEVDCNFRSWAYAARMALYSMWSAISQYKLHVGCCIEARDDSEMPERVLGCAQVSTLQLDDAPEWIGSSTKSVQALERIGSF